MTITVTYQLKNEQFMERPQPLSRPSINTTPIRSISKSVPEQLDNVATVNVTGGTSYVTKVKDAMSSKAAKILYGVTILTAAGAGCILGILFYKDVLSVHSSHYNSDANDTIAFLNGTELNTTSATIEILGANA